MNYIPYSSQNLVLVMEDLGVTRKRLAEESGLTNSAIGYYVRNEREPGLPQLKLLSWALSKIAKKKLLLVPEFDEQIIKDFENFNPGPRPPIK